METAGSAVPPSKKRGEERKGEGKRFDFSGREADGATDQFAGRDERGTVDQGEFIDLSGQVIVGNRFAVQPFSPQAKGSGKLMEFVERGIRDEVPTAPLAKPSRPAVPIVERVEQNGHDFGQMGRIKIAGIEPRQSRLCDQ